MRLTATPVGLCSLASVAGPPSPANPATPLPATVVIVPSGSMRRMRWFPASAMNTLPSWSSATPVGYCRLAAVAGPPSPRNEGMPLPAIVVIVPSGVTRRIR